MTEFAARISRVRMKEGADVHIIRPTPTESHEGVAAVAMSHAKMIAGNSSPGGELDGCVTIGLYSDGTSAIGYRSPKRLPRALLVAYLIEVLRRDIIVDNEAEEVFHSMFEWVDGGAS